MPYVFGMVISLTLPFVAGYLWWTCFAWWLQRVPPSRRALERAEKLGPPPPPIELVDARGNVRHEWAADLVQQRLRTIESQQRG
jgi:hypothetical protein